MRKAAVFVNPLLHMHPLRRAQVAAIAAALRRAGVQANVHELGAMAEAAAMVRKAIAEGCDTVFSCGGDGTAFALLQALAGTRVSLAIIPMGTGNVLAQNMSLPRNPVEAAQAMLRGAPREIALGKISTVLPDGVGEASWYFAMSAGMGAHATLMRSAQRWNKRTSGRAAYYLAGLDLLLRHQIESFEIEFTTTSGQNVTELVSEAIVVRVAELNRWRPGADLRSPTLRLATTNADNRCHLARAAFVALTRPAKLHPLETSTKRPKLVEYHDVSRVVCRRVVSHTSQAPPSIQADGEVLGSFDAAITRAAETLMLLWPGISTR